MANSDGCHRGHHSRRQGEVRNVSEFREAVFNESVGELRPDLERILRIKMTAEGLGALVDDLAGSRSLLREDGRAFPSAARLDDVCYHQGTVTYFES